MTNPLFYWSLLALCSVYVMSRGGAPERLGIGIVVIGSILSTASATDLGPRFRTIELGMFIVDIVVFFAFVALALVADRFWPLWVAGLQLVGTATHTVILANQQVVSWAYAVTQSLWGYPILLMIVIGTARHRRRLIRTGADPSWIRSFGFAGRPTPHSGRRP